MYRSWAGLAVLVATAAVAAVEGPGVDQRIVAARSSAEPVIDGQLDDPAWQAAPVFDGFVQRFPVPGPPSERTELRILYDDRHLYVAVRSHDTGPVNKTLGRRDGGSVGDNVQIIIDPTHDHRTAYVFQVNAGGVQSDGVLFDDRNYTTEWDAVWDSAVRNGGEGWTAELAIPLHLLRYPEADVQTWGFAVKREIFRKQEEVFTVQNPRDSGAYVSRIGHLSGLEGLRPRRTLELVPFLSARSVFAPYGNTRLLNPSADAGLDFKVGLTSDLTLIGAINPDFGTVEADQLILNLSTFENFFPEKRPFFNQGLELFAPVGNEIGGVPHQLFYSRRIGLTAPILAATKLTGSVAKGVEIGVLDAVVAGPWLAEDARADRSPAYSLTRPFHLGPAAELPTEAIAPTNYFAGVVRSSVGANSRVGASVASATPLTGPCGYSQSGFEALSEVSDLLEQRCLSRGGNAAALDFNLRTGDGQYAAMGQATVSQQVGGFTERTLRDGTVLARGDVGHGGYLRSGKFGGEHRFDVNYDFASNTLDTNATGFQRTQNDQHLFGGYHLVKANGWGPFAAVYGNLVGGQKFTTAALAPDDPSTQAVKEDKLHSRGGWLNGSLSLLLPSFDEVGLEAGMDIGGMNVREIPGTGVPLEFASKAYTAAFVGTNPSRAVRINGFAALGVLFPSALIPRPGLGFAANLTLRVRPTTALETTLEAVVDRSEHGARFLDTVDRPEGATFIFGDLQSNFASLTLRQQWILTPRLSLQAYAQLFSSYGFQHAYFEGRSQRGDPLTWVSGTPELRPTTSIGADFRESALNVNLLLRWEYRLGSNLFIVYTRSQQAETVPSGEPLPKGLAALLPRRLFNGEGSDAVMVKWTYYWSA